ncbi:MAG: response regulator [Pyrinomonadaceae bacterium]|nr:response regulator [Pyrinomonadaceae bacterium]
MKLEFESNIAAAPIFAGNYAADVDTVVEKDISRMLQSGVKAAQDGNRREARNLLLQVTEAAPDNENAWLWLASISDYPEELLVFLNNVLNINPNNARALEWAQATKSLLAKNFVQRGVDASNEAQMDLAKQCFLQAVVHDERNEMAWFWLASISDSAEEKISHLQKVLNINPENETALTSLHAAKTQVTESLLRKANTAAIAGERETAHEILEQIFKQTPDSEAAWIVKSYLADSFSDKIVCFEKVLSINPANDAAISGLASLREMMARTENRKSQNLAVVAAFLADANAENKPEAAADSLSADEISGDFVDCAEIIEDAQIVPEEIAAEDQAALETDFPPAIIKPRSTSFSFLKAIGENHRETETIAKLNDYQAAEIIVEETIAELETNGAYAAPPSRADYSVQEIYAPPPTVNFQLNSAEIGYSSNDEAVEPIRETSPAVKKVMVIDDSATVRKLIAHRLEMSGYEVICSADGIEALETIKGIVPDLILLDTAMPQMDGYQVCQAIRGNAATKDVPIVMISGKEGFFDKVRGQMSGSSGYIAKPFGPETLMKTVETYIL